MSMQIFVDRVHHLKLNEEFWVHQNDTMMERFRSKTENDLSAAAATNPMTSMRTLDQ